MNVDPALVKACQRGEAGALDALIRATYADVYALCRRMLAEPDDLAVTADLAARSEAALATLPEDARAVVVLRDIEGLSTKEVAELLGVTENVVKVRLHRAHARLRALVLGATPVADGGTA